MPIPNGALPRLTLPVYLLIGEITRVSLHDDGYIVTSEKVIYRVELSVFDPWSSMGFGFIPNLKAQPVVPTQFDSTLIYAHTGGSFVRADNLTDEESDAFELCIQEGPCVEWRVEPLPEDVAPMPTMLVQPRPLSPMPMLGVMGWNNVPIFA